MRVGFPNQLNVPFFLPDEKETKNPANLNSSVEQRNWRATHPSKRILKSNYNTDYTILKTPKALYSTKQISSSPS
jgi:hypothetical protein